MSFEFELPGSNIKYNFIISESSTQMLDMFITADDLTFSITAYVDDNIIQKDTYRLYLSPRHGSEAIKYNIYSNNNAKITLVNIDREIFTDLLTPYCEPHDFFLFEYISEKDYLIGMHFYEEYYKYLINEGYYK